MHMMRENNNSSPPRTFKPGVFTKCVSYLVVWSLTFSPLAAYPSPTPSKELAYQAALSRLDEGMKHLSQLRAEIDRSQFETEALVEKLNFDAEAIIKFVTEDIYFEQYEGLLRGAQGTLMSRAGNALDQAVLLSSLLKQAGYEAWIKKGSLSTQQAQTLLAQLSTVRTPMPSTFQNMSAAKEIMREMSQVVGIPEEKRESFIEDAFKQPNIKATSEYHDAESDAAFIASVLEANGKSIGEREITNKLLREAQDYFWVDYRLGPTDPLTPVHPAFGKLGKKVEGLQVLETYQDKIPEHLQHRFRFRVFLEQKKGSELVVKPMMKAWERPVSNLIGQLLLFNNQPDAIRKLNDLQDPGKIARKTQVLIPTFSLGEAIASEMNPFDLKGAILDKNSMNKGPTDEMASGLNKSFGKASSLFDGLGTSIGGSKKTETPVKAVENSALSAQWMEYTLIAPGGKEKTIKRYTIDRIGAKNRKVGEPKINRFVSSEEAIWKLARVSQFAVSPSQYPEAYTVDRYLQRMLTARHALQLSIKMSYFPDDKVSLTPEQLAGFNDYPALWFTAGIDTDIPLEKGEQHYQSEPFLLIANSGISFAEKKTSSHFTVDIANRGQRIIRSAKDRIFSNPQTAMLLGAWATRLEEVNMKGASDSSANQGSARKAFQLAKEMQIPVKLVTPDKKKALKNIAGLPTESRQAIKRDLDHGYMIIIPEKVIAKDLHVGWWRVNPDSGETLGMMSIGGAGFIEHLFENKFTLILGIQFGVFGTVLCMIMGDDCTAGQCLAVGALGWGSTFLVWGTLGYLFRAKEGIAYVIAGLGAAHDVFEGGTPFGPVSRGFGQLICD